MKWSLEALCRAGLLEQFCLQGAQGAEGLRLRPQGYRLAPFLELFLATKGDEVKEIVLSYDQRLQTFEPLAQCPLELLDWLVRQLTPAQERELSGGWERVILRPSGSWLRAFR